MVKKHTGVEPPEDPVLREIITGIVGEHRYDVAKEFMEGEHTADEVAERLGIRVNRVRRVLYALYENRVVGYRRGRDKQSGWYVYYWRIDPERALEHFYKNRHLLIQKLENRLDMERGTSFFGCGNGDPKLPFELAVENDFKCPRCGGRLEPHDNSNVVAALERRVESLRRRFLAL